jgi:hypothetical protein
MPAITVTWGELFDRIAGLELDLEGLADPAARAELEAELDPLREMARAEAPGAVHAVASELKDDVRVLRDLEGRIAACERDGNFGPDFVGLVRSLRVQVERRLDLERSIDKLMEGGSSAREGRDD